MTNDASLDLAFRTERMQFEPLTQVDGHDFLRIANDPLIADAVDFLHYPVTAGDIDRLIAGNHPEDCLFGGRLLATRELAAVVGLHRHGPEIEIGYLVRSDRHGQGLATEAAAGLIAALSGWFPGVAIAAECQPSNRESWHVLEKLGFQPTGRPGKREGRHKLELPALRG